jgi:hypothetical protein
MTAAIHKAEIAFQLLHYFHIFYQPVVEKYLPIPLGNYVQR